MKIAINGAGIAGPTLAYWLVRSGHEPVLIEQAPKFRTGGYMIDFWGVGYTIAERMGILPKVRESGYSVQEVRFVDDRGRKSGGFSTALFRPMTNDRFTSLPRGDLANAIYETIEDCVETSFDNSIASIEQRSSGVSVGFEHGPPREFDLVVGADGLHSRVRELVFGPESEFEKSLGYHVAAFEVEGYRPRDELIYVGYATPGQQIARFSLRNDRTMFLFVFTNDKLPAHFPRNANERKDILHRVFGDAGWECPQILMAMDRVEDIYFDRVSQIRMNAWSMGRVMLLGDAASCVSLLAGEGAGLAMAEAYVLAGELNLANGDYTQAFHRHEQRLRSFIEAKQQSAYDSASAFAPRTRTGLWFRNFISKLLSIPVVANYYIGRQLQDDFDLPEYELRTAPNSQSPEAASKR